MELASDWNEAFSTPPSRKEYVKGLLELENRREEAVATVLWIIELVSFLRSLEGEAAKERQEEWTDLIGYLDQIVRTLLPHLFAPPFIPVFFCFFFPHFPLRPHSFGTDEPSLLCASTLSIDQYLGSRTPSETPEGTSDVPLRLPLNLVESLEPVLPLSSAISLDDSTRSTLIDSIRAGLEHLSTIYPPPSSTSSTSLRDQIMFLLQKENPVDFPRPPASATRSSIMMTSRQLSGKEASQSIASILLNHYVFPEGDSSKATLPTAQTWQASKQEEDDDEEEEEDKADKRSIQTGIKEAKESIVRKEQKLEWLLGENYHKGPHCRTSPNNLSSSSTSSSDVASSSPIKRSTSATPTPNRNHQQQDEATSTIGALPEFPSRSLSEGRDSVDSVNAPSTVDYHRRSRVISTSSSTAPLIASSTRRSTTSTRDIPSPPPLPSSTSSPHRRVFSTGVLPPSTAAPFSFDPPLLSPALPTPPLQSLDSPTSSRPFAQLQTVTPIKNKRNSLDSARDDLREGRRESIPLDCQELSEKEKSELVRRNKKLEKLLGSRITGAATNVATNLKSSRRRWHSEDSELVANDDVGSGGGGGDGHGFDGRRTARPDSISIPSSQIEAVRQQPAPISPTTMLPLDDVSSCQLGPELSAEHQPTSSTSTNEPRPYSPRMQRSSSTPPFSSPTSPTFDLHLVPSNSSSTATTPSTIRSPKPRSSPFTRGYDSIEQEKRDERRRKLEKVRRVLGEKVPLGLVVHTKPQLYDYEQYELSPATSGTASSSMGMNKSKSRQMGDRLKEVFKQPERMGGVHDRENWVERRDTPQTSPDKKGNTKAGGGAGGGGGGLQGVEALTKARKLESLFGDLPPQSLYLSPASSLNASLARSSAPALRHRRSQSDIGTVSQPESFSTRSSYSSARGSLDFGLRRTRTNSSSVQSYQRSIASLRYVLERDPGALDEVVRAYTGDSARPIDAENTSSDSEGDHSSMTTQATVSHAGQTSSSSQAAVRKAQKLSSFFGTTKGEVWDRLLDDIASAVEEDEELEEDERKEVLENLNKLREGATHQQQQAQLAVR
ncbi:uncharacterized protein JCM6883_002203 [Sporobolomyces salmoneus]|uniref:uncharacterized protein n=1 Tax=Sporobolomyces salmoneus TaxID=183962 RepID=UPI003181F205